jgi:hypothetical protein
VPARLASEKGFSAVAHEPSAHPKKRKAEDENEDDGCRRDRAPATHYHLFIAEAAENAEARGGKWSKEE